MKRTEPILLWAVVAVLTPMLGFTAYLAQRAFAEGALFREAQVLPAEGRVNGNFYKVMGPVTGKFLGHKDYPEVVEALTYRISTERRPSPERDWAEDQNATVESGRVDAVHVDDVPVAINAYTKLIAPATVVHRDIAGTERKKIQFQQGAGATIVVYGIYNGGTMTEGSYERLLLVAPEKEAEILERIAFAGTRKGYVLSGVTLAILALMAGTVRGALRPLRPAKPLAAVARA